MRGRLALFLFAVAGCGETAGLPPAKPDLAVAPDLAKSPPDLAVPVPDLAVPLPDLAEKPIDAAGINCGGKTCGPGLLCCIIVSDAGMPMQACSKSCPDGGVAVTCDGPEDCPNAQSKICCAKLDVGAGNPPNCPLNSARAGCAGTCKTDIQLMCPSMNTVRLCHQPADCAADPAYDKCCEFEQGGATISFCVNNLISFAAKKCF